MKYINLKLTVYQLTKQYPEVKEILHQLGFTEILNPAMLSSVGRMTTLSKAAQMKKIPLEQVTDALKKAGFAVGEGEEQVPQERTEQLKEYLRRLSNGESLESVKADFAVQFKDVDAREIMQAEQQLIKEGTPLSEAKKLCDVHSALFHGATKEEWIAAADGVAYSSVQAIDGKKLVEQKKQAAATLIAVEGHPLCTFSQENKNLEQYILQLKEGLQTGDYEQALNDFSTFAVHYAKKGDLLYPQLKSKYGVSGPSDVMWTVDDEIRDTFSALLKETERGEAWKEKLLAVITRMQEMIYKENNILFPICAVTFTGDDWKWVYQGMKDYADCLSVVKPVWKEGEEFSSFQSQIADGVIQMPGGKLTVAQLTALLNTLPIEITFIDDKDINRYFNEGHKAFKRPSMALDREVYYCHPPKVETIVRGIIADFKAGTRDNVKVWSKKEGKDMLVSYYAVRNGEGAYLGAVEVVQDMEFAKAHFLENK